MNAERRQAEDRADSNTNKAEAENSSKQIFNQTFSQQIADHSTITNRSSNGSSERSGIWTTYDANGNPTSDCHGPIRHEWRHSSGSEKNVSNDGSVESRSDKSGANGAAAKYDARDSSNSFLPELPSLQITGLHGKDERFDPRRFNPMDELGSATGGDRAQITPMSDKQLEESSRKIIDTIEKSGNLGDEAQRKAIADLLKQAESHDSLPDLIGKLNAELAKKGLDYRFSVQNTTKTEITNDGPTFQNNNFSVSLRSVSTGQTVDTVRFQTSLILDYGHF
jgi:hypothetical protein